MLGISVTVRGRDRAAASHALVVSNHLSYIDIFVISSLYPSLFITSVEVQRAFFLGTMATYGGSIFVERRSKSRLHHDIEQVAAAITIGQPVVLFPEGTTSNGDGLLPFKASLFSVAENATITTQPICIRYQSVGKKNITALNRDTVYYYGDIGFFSHFFGLPFRGGMQVEITFLAPISPKADRTRKELCDHCRTEIEKVYLAPRE